MDYQARGLELFCSPHPVKEMVRYSFGLKETGKLEVTKFVENNFFMIIFICLMI